MDIDYKNNSIIIIAGILVVALGLFGLSLVRKRPPLVPDLYENEIKKIETQSDSNNLEDIEKDLTETELENIDKELQDIESELQASF